MTSTFDSEQWYAVGGSAALYPGCLMPATVLGSEIVVWRDSKGDSHAWQNQCVHRGLRLTLGFVDGDQLACRYHGWRYGAGGKCKAIPAHPGMTPPDDFKIPTHDLCEHGGLIWVSTGAVGEPIDLGIPDGKLHFCRDLVIRRDPERVAVLARRAIFKPFGIDAADIRYEQSEIAPSVIRIDAHSSGGTASVVLAIQPIAEDRAGLHVLAGGESEAERRHYADWARRLRWFMENPEAVTSSWRPLSDQPDWSP